MNALIIDDEPLPAKHLGDLIRKHCPEISHTEIINSPLAALDHLASHEYDLLFLDVEMPELDGFELLEAASLTENTQVIFTTAYSRYAAHAFEANATHYLVKLITKDALIKAVQKALLTAELIAQKRNPEAASKPCIISVFDGAEHHLIRETDIFRLEGERSYARIVHSGKELLASKNIGYYETKLSKHLFFRCHHSHLVNLRHIIRLGKGKSSYLVLSNGDTVPLSSSKKNALINAMGLDD